MRMGTELKQRLMSSLQSTIGSVYSLGWMSAGETSTTAGDLETTAAEPAQQQAQQQPEEPTGPVSSQSCRRRWYGCDRVRSVVAIMSIMPTIQTTNAVHS